MPRAITVKIDERKSYGFLVKGVAIIDGIEVPFTVYKSYRWWNEELQTRLNVKSKSSIIEKYQDKDHIKNTIRDTARGWWIDEKNANKKAVDTWESEQ